MTKKATGRIEEMTAREVKSLDALRRWRDGHDDDLAQARIGALLVAGSRAPAAMPSPSEAKRLRAKAIDAAMADRGVRVAAKLQPKPPHNAGRPSAGVRKVSL